MQADPTSRAYCQSPLGILEVKAQENSITQIQFIDSVGISDSSHILDNCVKQLDEYFSGKREEFSFPLAPEGTAFQKQVWQELQNIPFGEKRSYLDIAIKLGDKNLTRAVGASNGKNPIAIIIPCHRVIGENGKLTGYAGGLWRKEWLLDFESKSPQEKLF